MSRLSLLLTCLLLLVFPNGFNLACSSPPADGDAPDEAEVASRSEALTGSCTASGACTLSIRLPNGLTPHEVLLAANSSLRVGDGSLLRKGDDSPALSTNSGGVTGPSGSWTAVGSQARAGTLYSVPPVEVRSQGGVLGDVVSAGAVTRQDSSAFITGTVRQNTSLEPFTTVSWSVTWPAVTEPTLTIERGVTVTRAPGSFGTVNVRGGGVLRLRSGTYFFDRLALESDAVIELDNAAGPVYLYTRQELTWRGTNRRTTDLPNVLVVYLGSNQVVLERPFHGSIVAPNAQLVLRTVQAPWHRGSFAARDIEIDRNQTILHWPFEVPDCSADTNRCGTVLGCPPADTDRDGLTDCYEDNDDFAWTDRTIFNGVETTVAPKCHSAPSCTLIDSAAEVNACAPSAPLATQNEYSGWDWTVPSSATNLCSRAHDFRPPFTPCGENWQLESTGKIALESSGQHCFRVAGQTSAECGSLFFGTSTTGVTTGQTQCFDTTAGIYDIRWFWEGNSGSSSGLQVLYCYGGASTCTPTQPLPSRLLRPEYEGTEPPCDTAPGRCTDLCPCGPGNDCEQDSDCAEGLTCTAGDGAAYGKSPEQRICTDPGCQLHARELGCGTEGARCGWCHPPLCDRDSDCPSGLVCGRGNGGLFGLPGQNVCWNGEACPSESPPSCGSPRHPCGNCTCVPDCSQATCGASTGDGCGGQCPSVCEPRQRGCTHDIHCPGGFYCAIGQGQRIGLPAGTNVCLPRQCSFPRLRSPECGTPEAPCGTCPDAGQSCSGRSCGMDPLTGADCGRCGDTQFCDPTGQCLERQSDGPLSIPDGQGGSRPLDPLPPSSTATLGKTPGSFEVSDRGSPTYTIPIVVPPGRAGLEPELALQYVGTQTNGDLGVGWQLTGQSAITRCPKNFALDRRPAPIQKDETDEFCLDGKRLKRIVCSEGMGSCEYRTLVDSIARVTIRFGDNHNDVFEVETKDGRSLTYGGYPSDRATDSSGVTISWALSRVEDRDGNYIRYDYVPEEFVGTKTPRLTSITYANGYGGMPGGREVRIEQDEVTRPDPIAGYMQGGLPYSSHRLIRRIVTLVQGTPVRSYNLSYETAPNGVSRITSVSECAGADMSVCKPATRFEYHDEPLFEYGLSTRYPQSAWLDVDGDGISDALRTDITVSGGELTPGQHVANYSAAAVTMVMPPAYGIPASIMYTMFTRGVLGWGQPEVNISHELYLQTGERQECGAPWPGPCPGDGTSPPNYRLLPVSGLTCFGRAPSFTLDYDGDGRDDVLQLCMDPGNSSSQELAWELRLARSVGTGDFVNDRALESWVGTRRGILLDLNGDGLEDFLRCGSPLGMVARLRVPGGDFGLPHFFGPPSAYCMGTPAYPLDIDGDGAAELLTYEGDGRWFALDWTPSGPEWIPDVIDASVGMVGRKEPLFFDDLNGDGLVDIFSPDVRINGLVDGIRPILFTNTGGKFRPGMVLPMGWLPEDPAERYIVADFDGDRRADVLQYHPSGPGADRTHLLKLVPGTGMLQTTSVPELTARWSGATDLDGDGSLDLIYADNHAAFYGAGSKINLLRRVVDGAGAYVRVDYERQHEGRAPTYTAGEGCSWPERCIKQVPHLVSRYETGYVQAGHPDIPQQEVYLTYHDARVDLAGHGWLGFGRRRAYEHAFVAGASQQRRFVETEYEPFVPYTIGGQVADPATQAYFYPFAGFVKTTTVTSQPTSSALTTEPRSRQVVTANTYELHRGSGSNGSRQSYFPALRARSTTVSEWDHWFSSQYELSTTTEQFTTDDFGNVTRHETHASNLHTTVSTTYEHPSSCDIFCSLSDPRVRAWQISLPRERTVSSWQNPRDVKTLRTAFTHDSLGRLETITRKPGTAEAVTTTLHYASDGNIDQIEEANAARTSVRTTEISYDSARVYPQTIVNPLGQAVQVRYDERFGVPVAVVDPNGIPQRWSYDGFGRLTGSDGPDGLQEIVLSAPESDPDHMVRFDLQLQITSTRQDGSRTKQILNKLDQLVFVKELGLDGVEFKGEIVYDALGRVVRRERPHVQGDLSQGATEYEYDALDRVLRVRNADGSERRFQYATASSLVEAHRAWLTTGAVEVAQSLDEDGKSSTAIYDALGNQLRHIDGFENQPADYRYGVFNRLVSMTDKLGARTEFHFDAFDRLDQVTDPNAGVMSYTYTAFDEIETTTDAAGNVRTFRYDELGRLRRIEEGSDVTRFEYDGTGVNTIGRLVEIVAPPTASNPTGHRESYTYEPPTATGNRGLLQSITTTLDGQPFTSTLHYDGAARLERIEYPEVDGQRFAVRYAYDGPYQRRVFGIQGGVETMLWELVRAEHGYRIAEERFGNQATTTYGYEPRTGRLSSIQTNGTSGTIQHWNYRYYHNGALLERWSPGRTEAFGYDAVNALEQHIVTGNDPVTRNYFYNANGTFQSTSELGAYSYNDPTGRPHLPNAAGQYSLQYDAKGNVTQRSGSDLPGGGHDIAYTSFDLPSLITPLDGSAPTSFEYSADERRVVKRGPAATTYYVGELYRRIVPADGSPTQHRFAVYAAGRQVAELAGTSGTSGLTTYYLHDDSLGSVTAISDATQSYRQEFTAYGRTLQSATAATGVVAGFTGHEHDAELGLINMRGRVYDPAVGRFLTADPVMQAPFSSQGLNRFSYVFNSPTNFVDPSGFVSTGYQDRDLAIGTGAYSAGLAAGTTSIATGGFGLGGGLGLANALGLTNGLFNSTPNATYRQPGHRQANAAPRGGASAADQNKGGVGPAVPESLRLCRLFPCVAENGAGGASNGGGSEGASGTGEDQVLSDTNVPGAIGEFVVLEIANFVMCVLGNECGIGGVAAAMVFRFRMPAARALTGAARIAKHHIFPQQFRRFFASKGVDIDRFTIRIAQETTHLKGVHGRGLGNMPGRWNARWAEFIQANPDATAKDIYQFAGKLLDEFGLEHLPIIPY